MGIPEYDPEVSLQFNTQRLKEATKEINENGYIFLNVKDLFTSKFTTLMESNVISEHPDLENKKALFYYDKHTKITCNLMVKKNHDYGEAWKDMRVSSLTDLILQKILRIKQIEDNQGKTIISEGIDANYLDIVNYGIFSLILYLDPCPLLMRLCIPSGPKGL